MLCRLASGASCVPGARPSQRAPIAEMRFPAYLIDSQVPQSVSAPERTSDNTAATLIP